MKTATLKPPTYPARPINGGPLPLATRKFGRWFYEPKLNGWRALVHTPTGAMWNRHGERLTIEKEFRPVLESLRRCELEWLDCEALERRHDLGRGSLVMLDYLPSGSTEPTWEERQEILFATLCTLDRFTSWAFELIPPKEDAILWMAHNYESVAQQAKAMKVPDEELDPARAWVRLQEANRAFGVELFEGLVAKRADSPYPITNRPEHVTPWWIKHRWFF